MLVMIHDRYYRDSPESLLLTAFVDPKEEERLLCTVAFKAGHAPEEAGGRSRPPQELQLLINGPSLSAWLATLPDQQPLHAETDAIRELICEDGVVTSSSKRWQGLRLRAESASRQAIELKVLNRDDRCLMTLYWPLGVWADFRRAVYNMRHKHKGRSVVLSWACEPYVNSLPAKARFLD